MSLHPIPPLATSCGQAGGQTLFNSCVSSARQSLMLPLPLCVPSPYRSRFLDCHHLSSALTALWCAREQEAAQDSVLQKAVLMCESKLTTQGCGTFFPQTTGPRERSSDL